MRFIPTRIHGVLDYAVGVLLVAAPWLFGFAPWVWAPHLVIGLFEIGAALLTRTAPERVGTMGTAGRMGGL